MVDNVMDGSDSHWRPCLRAARKRLESCEPLRFSGRITRVTGMVIEAVGLQLPIGSLHNFPA